MSESKTAFNGDEYEPEPGEEVVGVCPGSIGEFENFLVIKDALQTDYSFSLSFESASGNHWQECRHAYDRAVTIESDPPNSGLPERPIRRWRIPLAAVAYNEGGANMTAICLLCAVEEAREKGWLP